MTTHLRRINATINHFNVFSMECNSIRLRGLAHGKMTNQTCTLASCLLFPWKVKTNKCFPFNKFPVIKTWLLGGDGEARIEAGARLRFYTCLWFRSLGGVSDQTQGVGWGSGGGCLGPDKGGSRPRPRGCIPACTEADTPQQTAMLRAVHILLDCILVKDTFAMVSFQL